MIKDIDPRLVPLHVKDLATWGKIPIPWFVTEWVGEGPARRPDFRVVTSARVSQAVAERRCWICGGNLNPQRMTWATGPMCVVNRISSEPPQHLACAKWAAMVCPFMVDPNRGRRAGGLVSEAERDPNMICRNPGVTALFITDGFHMVRGDAGRLLFNMNRALGVQWIREGRTATRAEVEAATVSGLPILEAEANERGGLEALKELRDALNVARGWWPA